MMHVFGRLLDPQLVEMLDQYAIGARKVMIGQTAGEQKSTIKGASIEFRQHRAYVSGDDHRHIDWRVLARTDRMYVREYDEETSLRAVCFLDASGSMGYGTPTSKLEYAARLSAAVSYILTKQNAATGVSVASEANHVWLAPASMPDQLSRIIQLLESATATGKTSIVQSILKSAGHLGRRSLTLIFSDCFLAASEITQAVARLTHDGHEVLLVRVLHPDEIHFPFQTWTRFAGMENEKSLLTEAPAMREMYLQRFKAHSDTIELICNQFGARQVVLDTSMPVIESIRKIIQRSSA